MTTDPAGTPRTPSRRRILEQVAAGELTPEEAEEQLRGVTEAPPVQDSSVTKVVIRAGAGALEVIGDPSVAQTDVEGPHHVSIEGDTLVIRGELDPSGPGGFTFNFGGGRRRMRFGDRGVVVGRRHISSLRVRMNPALELDAELDAGPLLISGVTGSIRARLSAGPMTIEHFEGPLDLSVNAGAIRAVGKLTRGESRIRSDAGAVKVQLHPSSDVHVKAHAALGKVSLFSSQGESDNRFGTDRRHEASLGSGNASLRVDTAMGSVHVSVG